MYEEQYEHLLEDDVLNALWRSLAEEPAVDWAAINFSTAHEHYFAQMADADTPERKRRVR